MNEQQEERTGISMKAWAQLVGAALVLVLVVVPFVLVLVAAWPTIQRLAPWSATVLTITLTLALPILLVTALVCGVLWLRSHAGVKHFQGHLAKPNQNGAYAAYWDGRKWVQPENAPLPIGVSVPQTVHSAGLEPRQVSHLIEMVLAKLGTTVQEEQALALPSGEGVLPEYISYEDVRPNVPRKHALVGVDAHGVVSRLREDIKGLIWVVGASGTGKTTSVSIRLDEDYHQGHWFYVIDPHWFKPDSLWNAIKDTPYAQQRLILPMAYELVDIIDVLDAFLEEFEARKHEKWSHPITLVIDEVGSLVSDKPETDEERLLRDKIKKVARICGQESRGFDMAGIFISQQATGLSWLRNRALLVIAHQLVMMSERKLACNDNAEMAREMDNWPRGRTYVYGIGLTSGPQLVQQPYYEAPTVESTLVEPGQRLDSTFPFDESEMESTPLKVESEVESSNQAEIDGVHEPGQPMDSTFPFDAKLFRQAQKMLRERSATFNEIICEVWSVQENTRAFRTAKEEFRLMLAYMASMVGEDT